MVLDTDSEVWVVVHPMEGADYWVQPRVTVREGGRWRVLCYFGEPGQHHGKLYEVMAVSNPTAPLAEGMVLPAWPAAAGSSQPIEVVRD